MFKTAAAHSNASTISGIIQSLCPVWEERVPWTALTGAVTLHIAKDMVPVCTVEKPEVHPHAENVRPQVCAMKPQWGMSQARGSRQALLPGQKCVKKKKEKKKKDKHTSTQLMSRGSTNMWCLLCNAMQMLSLVYIASGIQNTVCKQKAPFAKKNDDVDVNTLSISMGKLVCFYKYMQSDRLNVCWQLPPNLQPSNLFSVCVCCANH